MIYIEKQDWLSKSYGRICAISDVLTEPVSNLISISNEERSKIRNTQSFEGDVVRILGYHERYALIMKIDGVVGWVESDSLKEDSRIQSFVRPISPRILPIEFLKKFEGVPYLWGGLSEKGIDCSGLTQRYFFEVFDLIIPRNSRDQRKYALEKSFDMVKDHDLVFSTGKRSGQHHVGIFLDNKIWNSYPEEGVICQSVERFSEFFLIEAINSPT